MLATPGIDKDFRFLVLAVIKQVEKAGQVLREPGDRLREAIKQADDYIDLLKSRIENRCYTSLRGNVDADLINAIKATNVVTTNLERIADFAVNIARQTERLRDATMLTQYDVEPMVSRVRETLRLVEKALNRRDAELGFQICRAEADIDRSYQKLFDRVLAELGAGGRPDDLVTALFIFHYLERMGDALLNIGEAILSVVMGERLKIRQYAALRETLEEAELSDVGFEAIWGTRSGCRLGKVWEKGEGEDHGELLFKEGSLEKLQLEKQNIDRWNELLPGLPPKVLHMTTEGEEASLMLEYLGGHTLQEMVLNEDVATIDRAVAAVETTLEQVWTRTMRRTPVSANYLGQLAARAEDVYRVHPDFRRPAEQIGDMKSASLTELLDSVREVDGALVAPFSVLIHGDFNLDNIIFDPVTGQLHFIDLHRSTESDYLQDVSIFLASNFRLPVFDSGVRSRIGHVIGRFLGFARRFASSHGDQTMEARLGLAMVRSLMTSTRFELKHAFARSMFERAVYLLERLANHRGHAWTAFKFPDNVLIL